MRTTELSAQGLIDDEAEECAVACCLVDAGARAEVLEVASPGHFSPPNRWFMEAIVALDGRGEEINVISVAREVDVQGVGMSHPNRLAECGGQTALHDAIRAVPAIEGARWYAEQVRRAAELRRLVTLGHELMQAALQPGADPGELTDRWTGRFLASGEARRHLTSPASRVVGDDVAGRIAEWLDDPRAIPGVSTGFSRLDRLIGGLAPGRVTMLAADTGVGKSLLAHHVIRTVAGAGVPVLAFTTEMSETEVGRRMVFAQAGVDPVAVAMRGVASFSERDSLWNAVQRLSELPWWVCDVAGIHLASLVAEARRYRHAHGVQVVVVDHLEMVRADGRTEVERYQAITSGLKALAQDHDLAVLAVSHINRQAQREGITHYGLKGASSKEQDADAILLLQAVGEDGKPLTKAEAAEVLRRQGWVPVDLRVAKNRHGPEGTIRLRLDWTQGGRFYEVIA